MQSDVNMITMTSSCSSSDLHYTRIFLHITTNVLSKQADTCSCKINTSSGNNALPVNTVIEGPGYNTNKVSIAIVVGPGTTPTKYPSL